jgi:hypothetical protein
VTGSAILETTGRKGEITCRFTLSIPDGPAPYFTVQVLGDPGKLGAQWLAIKGDQGRGARRRDREWRDLSRISVAEIKETIAEAKLPTAERHTPGMPADPAANTAPEPAGSAPPQAPQQPTAETPKGEPQPDRKANGHDAPQAGTTADLISVFAQLLALRPAVARMARLPSQIVQFADGLGQHRFDSDDFYDLALSIADLTAAWTDKKFSAVDLERLHIVLDLYNQYRSVSDVSTSLTMISQRSLS